MHFVKKRLYTRLSFRVRPACMQAREPNLSNPDQAVLVRRLHY